MKLLKLFTLFSILNIGCVFSQEIIIKNAKIINVEKGIVEGSRNIYIENGLIKKITYTNNKLNNNAKVIDANGNYIMPGFIESHVHVAIGAVKLKFENKKPFLAVDLIDEIPDLTLKLMLSNGITSARDPGGLTEVTVRTKNNVESGKLLGPELFVAGNILDTLKFENLTTQIKTHKDIIDEINNQKKKGVDFIKLYTSLSPEQLEVGINHARKIGLKSISHLHTTSWTEAAKLKLDNIVHIIPGNERLLPKDKRKEYLKYANLGAIAFYKWFEYVDLESKEISEMIKALKDNNVSVDPTLVPFHSAFFGDTGNYQSQESLKYLPKPLLENWKTTFNFNLGWKAKDYEIAHKVWPKVEQLVRMLHKNGIMLTAGTDANNPYMVPGFSYHQELQLLKKCGLSNQEVLKIAIINGAKLLGIENKVGKVKKGYQADLIILKENPLEDITNTSSVYKVIVNGKSYEKEDILNELKRN